MVFVQTAQTSFALMQGRLDLDGKWDQQPTTPLIVWQSRGQISQETQKVNSFDLSKLAQGALSSAILQTCACEFR